MMRRRAMLTSAAGTLLGGADAPRLSLRDAGQRAGLPIGSSSEVDLSQAPDYARLIARECSLFAPNMSWQRMAPTQAQTIEPDPNIALVRRADLALTGYHLLWHQRLPSWFDALDRAAAERAIVAHIRSIAAQYGPQTDAWNVVNEAIRPADHARGGLRRSPLLDKFGTAVFDIAFAAARDAAPAVLRVYNDYDFELATSSDRARRAALLGLLDELGRRAVPIQAVGLQCHLRSQSFDRFDPVAYRRFLDEIASRGLAILITELDVQDMASGGAVAQDATIADVYRRFLDVALAQPRVHSVTFWGLSDRYSWLNDPARPNYRRPDGELGRSLPFDRDLRPKPAFDAITRSIARRGAHPRP